MLVRPDFFDGIVYTGAPTPPVPPTAARFAPERQPADEAVPLAEVLDEVLNCPPG